MILNKAATLALPSAYLASIQFAFAVVVILIAEKLHFLKLDPMKTKIVIPYLKYCTIFLLGVYTNMQSLSQSSVDTVIVFRSSTPLLVCLMDVMFMGRANPSTRSIAAMSSMVVGATLYVNTDSQFKMDGFKVSGGPKAKLQKEAIKFLPPQKLIHECRPSTRRLARSQAYFWVVAYFVIISIEMIFGKKITSSVKCSLATSVFLTNLGTLPAMLALSVVRGEDWSLQPIFNNPAYLWVLLFSCLAGTGIGFAGWWCRSLLSATSFTVVGICNKIVTVILNITVWDKHASPFGTMCLMVCLGGGIMYQQAPMRREEKKRDKLVEDTVGLLVKEEMEELGNTEERVKDSEGMIVKEKIEV